MSTTPSRIHMKLKYTGAARKIDCFNFIAGTLDLDWPHSPKHLRRGYPEKLENLQCKDCGGAIYRTPNLDPEAIKILAKQIDETARISGGLKIKIRKFTKNPKCGAEPETDDLIPETDEDGGCASEYFCG